MEISIKKGYINNEDEFYKIVKVEEGVERFIINRNYLNSVECGKILSNTNFLNLKYVNL